MGQARLRPWLRGIFGPGADSGRDSADPSFYVELQDAHREYSLGSKVGGTLVLRLERAQVVESVLIEFRGAVEVRTQAVGTKVNSHVLFEDSRVLWLAAEAERPPSRSGSSSVHTTGSRSAASVGSDAARPPDSNGPPRVGEKLTAGEHRFPFELELPTQGLTSSLDFDRGSISYTLTGVLQRSSKRSRTTAPRHVTVVCPVDVATLPKAKVVSLMVNIGKRAQRNSSNNKLVVKLELPQKGYLKGERIPVALTVQHIWNVQSPSSVVVTLSRISGLFGDDGTLQTYRKDLSQSILPLYTDKVTNKAVINTVLAVPPEAFPSIVKPKLVSFQYLIEVALELTGKLDIAKFANSDPSVPFIDTDRFKHRNSVVSAWTEVIIGTHRSERADQLVSSDAMSTNTSTYMSVTPSMSSSDRESVGTGTGQLAYGERHSINFNQLDSVRTDRPPEPYACHFSTTEVSQRSAADEKAALSARADALLPSAPNYHGLPRPAFETPHLASTSAAASSPAGLASQLHARRASDVQDKRELELQRLQGLASEPLGDAAPKYDRVAPADSHSTTCAQASADVTLEPRPLQAIGADSTSVYQYSLGPSAPPAPR